MKHLIFLFIFSLMGSFTCQLRANEPVVTITTNVGVMKAKLYDNVPNHVKTFIERAKKGEYDGTLFTRVIKDFMIQGGAPDSRNASPGVRVGFGDRSAEILPELRPEYFHKKGALAAPRQNDDVNPEKKSDMSQFFIVEGKVYRSGELDTLEKVKNYQIRKKALDLYYRPVKVQLQMLKMDNPREYNKRVAAINAKIDSMILATPGHLVFTDELPLDTVDVIFFCTAHGDTKKFMESHTIPENVKIIDLSMDYRIKDESHDFVYGLPELNRRTICQSKHVANPGCFATCIQLGLLPLAKHLMLNDDVMVNAITGSTGAGVKPGVTTHFSWRNNNMSVYKPFAHQHVPEIKQSLKQLQNSFNSEIDFIPYRGDFARGIFATIVVKTKVELEEIVKIYKEYYAEDSFTHIVEKNIDLKQVVNTNKCLIHLEKHGDKLLIISCIDNLLKGASGQAVHNMNLMFNLEETTGLMLKPSAF